MICCMLVEAKWLTRVSCLCQEDTEEVPSLSEMRKYNTSRLQLPKVPMGDMAAMKAKPLRSSSWTAPATDPQK